MLNNLFLRDKDDSSGSDEESKKELESKESDAESQDSEKVDSSDKEKKEELSAEAKAELETLKKDKEDLEKRLSDTQEGFHEKNKALIALNERVDQLTRPQIKPEDEFADDLQIQKIDRKIKAYQDNEYDTASLDELRTARIREIKLEGRLANLEARGMESDEIGNLLIEEPDIKDFKPVGEARKKLTERGEKVSMDTAYYYDLGKKSVGEKSKVDFKSAVKAEVEKRLETDKKGDEARTQDGDFNEPEVSEDKEMTEYADQLTDPSGLDIQ